MKYQKILISDLCNVFDEGWNGCGVYTCIGNYVSSTFKNPIYIGSTENLQRRIEKDHIGALNGNRHDNYPFQCGWNKHNKIEGFTWYLLESCNVEDLLIVEQKYLDLYRPFVDEFGGFNIHHFTGKPPSFKGGKHSEEAKRKIGEASRGKNNPFYGKKHSEESRKKLSIARRKRIISQETKDKMSKSMTGKNFGPRSEDHKEKLRQANKGKKTSKFWKESFCRSKKKIK